MITKFSHALHLYLEELQEHIDSYEIQVLGRENLSMPTPIIPYRILYLLRK